ncbi:GL15190 [Drosophila persimilis]|uniref:GL15190 n=1 Tax=Drosophila persimilis TaxID=7234 RepID=B4H3L1_DROPE|nr:GL15190 [Drosophila persimilis]
MMLRKNLFWMTTKNGDDVMENLDTIELANIHLVHTVLHSRSSSKSAIRLIVAAKCAKRCVQEPIDVDELSQTLKANADEDADEDVNANANADTISLRDLRSGEGPCQVVGLK